MIDASGGFTQTQVDTRILRMQQVGVVPVGYSNVSVEILADDAAPEATAVYSALGMPFSRLLWPKAILGARLNQWTLPMRVPRPAVLEKRATF